jgi:hypothetical protein
VSSTARGGKRSPADFYATPAWPVHRLLDSLFLPGGRWLEPAAGDGAIIRAVNHWRGVHGEGNILWTAVEKRRSCERKLIGTPGNINVFIGDFFPASDVGSRYDVVISNDPFSRAMQFINATMVLATWSIHLLRLNFLGTEERNEFFKNNMPDIYVIPDRVSFAKSLSCTRNKRGCTYAKIVSLSARVPRSCPRCGAKLRVSTTDSIEYAWFVWGPERGRRAGKIVVLDHTPLEERK